MDRVPLEKHSRLSLGNSISSSFLVFVLRSSPTSGPGRPLIIADAGRGGGGGAWLANYRRDFSPQETIPHLFISRPFSLETLYTSIRKLHIKDRGWGYFFPPRLRLYFFNVLCFSFGPPFHFWRMRESFARRQSGSFFLSCFISFLRLVSLFETFVPIMFVPRFLLLSFFLFFFSSFLQIPSLFFSSTSFGMKADTADLVSAPALLIGAAE